MSKKHRRRLFVLATAVIAVAVLAYRFRWHGLCLLVLPAQPPPAFAPSDVPPNTAWREHRFKKLTAGLPSDWAVKVTGTATKMLSATPPPPAAGMIVLGSQESEVEVLRRGNGNEDYPGPRDLYLIDRRDALASRNDLSPWTHVEEATWLARKARINPLAAVAEGENDGVIWLIGLEKNQANAVAYPTDRRWRLQLFAQSFSSPDAAAAWLHAVCGRLKFDP